MSKITQQEHNGLFELTAEARAELGKSKYFNDDLAPTTVSQRNWPTSSICNLWIGMSICIPSLSLASSLIGIAVPSLVDPANTVAMPGNPAVQVGQLIGFFLFMALVFWVAYNGLDQVKWVQDIGGPILLVVIILLGYWSIDMLHDAGYTVAQAFAQGNDWATIEANGGFAFVYMAGLTANIAFWATMALNIPEFSRYASSQKSQFRGQLYGMPLPMALCAFVGALFGQATKLALGTAMFDPTGLFYYVDNKLLVAIAAIGVMMATITTCVAANVVAPANGFSNISAYKIS